MDTLKLSIIANARRVIELLESDSHRSELIKKIHELRRDTIRLEGMIKGLFRVCSGCEREFKAKNSYENKCGDCKWKEYLQKQKEK